MTVPVQYFLLHSAGNVTTNRTVTEWEWVGSGLKKDLSISSSHKMCYNYFGGKMQPQIKKNLECWDLQLTTWTSWLLEC